MTRRHAADAVILTALRSELEAFRAAVDAPWTDAEDPGEHPIFECIWRGRKLIAAWAPSMGPAAAAARLAQLLNWYEPTVVAMCGICAGHPKRVALGDVVVADRVYDYAAGKLTVDGHLPDLTTFNLLGGWKMHAEKLMPRGPWSGGERLGRRPTSLAEHGEEFVEMMNRGEQPDRSAVGRQLWMPIWRFLEQSGYVDGVDEGRPELTDGGRSYAQLLAFRGRTQVPSTRAHIGPMASGPAVRADGVAFDELTKGQRKLLAIDMEAAAVGRVAHGAERRFIVVKGVSDFGDGFKNDAFHAYAMKASASFLEAFLDNRLPRRDTGNIRTPITEEPPRPPAGVDIDALVQATIRRRLDRDLLLSWLPDGMRTSLPNKRSYFEQVQSDLTHLAKEPQMGDGQWPLAIWLRQAERLAGPFAEARVYRAALDRLAE